MVLIFHSNDAMLRFLGAYDPPLPRDPEPAAARTVGGRGAAGGTERSRSQGRSLPAPEGPQGLMTAGGCCSGCGCVGWTSQPGPAELAKRAGDPNDGHGGSDEDEAQRRQSEGCAGAPALQRGHGAVQNPQKWQRQRDDLALSARSKADIRSSISSVRWPPALMSSRDALMEAWASSNMVCGCG